MENPKTRIRVATAGEALIDLVGDAEGNFRACVGGSVFNFTRALALQDVGTAYLNPLSGDAFGRQLARALIDTGAVLAQPEAVARPTSLALVQVDRAGQPSYGFYRDGVADRAVDAAALLARTAALPHLEAVCTGCLALAPADQQRYLPWLRACRERGLAVVVDANLRPSAMDDPPAWRNSVRQALSQADLAKVSDEDLRALHPEAGDVLALARGLFALGPLQWVALTCGADGAHLLARDGRHWHARASAPLQVEDTVGAGDCFLAGLVAGLLDARALRGGAPDQALQRAVASASHCVRRRGCQPPRADELGADALAGVTVQAAG